jgi:hypothetical protein
LVWGEPNSPEWKSPEEGVRYTLDREKCAAAPRVAPTSMGKLRGAEGILVCGDRVLKVSLVFRPHGGLIYWLRLETTFAHRLEDENIQRKFAATFSLIRWE